ncbi:MAG: cupredoxin family copper-binding protein [Solirubrobacteraceae bacterium]
MRFFRLLPAAVIAIALFVAPVDASARHRPQPRPHKRHHRHVNEHARSHAATVELAGGALRAGGAVSSPARPATAHAANDTSVTISDFQFTPATITIHVGDTVTWANHGPSAHTATANDSSFNTGVLQKGHSASHTFTTAGTFTYICQIHPFMHGTVVVLANTTSTTTPKTTTTPATTTPASTTPSSTTSATAGQLPNTGFAVPAILLAGVLLTGLGLAVRKKLRA